MFNYKVIKETNSDYKMILTYKADKAIITKFLELAKNKLKKINIDASVADAAILEQFDIPEEHRYLMVTPLHQSVKKHIRKVAKFLERRDKFSILTHRVDNAIYTRTNKGDWIIDIIVKGTFILKE